MPKYTDYKYDPITGDRVIDKGAFAFVYDADVIRQNVETSLRSSKNDWFLDLTEGITYFDNDAGLLGTKKVTLRQEAEINNAILSTTGVEILESLTFDLEDNKLTINATYYTEFGTRDEIIVEVG